MIKNKKLNDTYYRVIDKDISEESLQLMEKLIQSVSKDLEEDGVDSWAIPEYIGRKVESMLPVDIKKVI